MVRLSSFCKDKTPASLLKWTLRKTTTIGQIRHLATDGTVIVGAGDTAGKMAISLDKGITWVEYTSGVSFSRINFMYWDGAQFWAMGSTTGGYRFIAKSPDGSASSWTQVTNGPAAGTNTPLYGMVKGPAGYMAVGLGSYMYSPDGIYWYTGTGVSGMFLQSVICINGVYVASGNTNDNYFFTSSNMQALTQRNSPFTTGTVCSVNYAGGQAFLRSSTTVKYGGGLATSTDGITWTIIPDNNVPTGWDLEFGNSIWVSSQIYSAETYTSKDNLYYFSQPICGRGSTYVHRILFMNTVTDPRFFALNFNSTIYST